MACPNRRNRFCLHQFPVDHGLGDIGDTSKAASDSTAPLAGLQLDHVGVARLDAGSDLAWLVTQAMGVIDHD